MTHRAMFLAFLALAGSVPATLVLANDAKPQQATPKALDAVIVTARYREEVLQRIPLSLTALDAMELDSRGAIRLDDLGAAVPNLTLFAARPFNNAITAYIRGVGQSDTVWGLEPGVGVYIDDVYLARPQAALLEILDVERIEVLRGPQGTLYGKNAIGGAIRYVTRQPGETVAGSLGANLGDHGQRDLRATLNLPAGSQWRSRVALASLNRDGYGTNLYSGAQVSAQDADVARASTVWTPNEDVDVTLAFDRFRDRSGPRGAKRLAVNRFDPLRRPPTEGNHDVQSGMPDLDEMDAQGLSATVAWNTGNSWQLKSITAHRESDSNANVDFDLLPLPISDLNRVLFEEQTSQEFRAFTASERSQTIAGLYFFTGEAGGRVSQNSRNQLFSRSSGSVETRSAAAYLDHAWAMNDQLTLETGLRYTSEEKTGTVLNQAYTNENFDTPSGAPRADFTDSETFGSLSPRINLAWRFSEAAMAYAQASRGFKSGGYNIRANTQLLPETGEPFDQETATSYELGAKTQWLGGSITLNAAVFHTDYRDIQLSVFSTYDSNGDGIDDSQIGVLKNAGRATIKGAELELTAGLTPSIQWLFHAGYLDAGYDEFISAGVDIADTQGFANSPRWTSGSSALANIRLRKGRGWLQLRLDGNYQSRTIPSADLVQNIAQAGYTLWNASLSYRSPSDRWQWALRGHNLGDKAYRVTGYDFPALGIRSGFFGPPRRYSLAVTYSF